MARPGGECAVPARAAQRGCGAVQRSAGPGAARSGAVEGGAALQPRGRAARAAPACGRAGRLLRGRGGRPGLPARAAAPRRYLHRHRRPPLRHAGKPFADACPSTLSCMPTSARRHPFELFVCSNFCVCLLFWCKFFAAALPTVKFPTNYDWEGFLQGQPLTVVHHTCQCSYRVAFFKECKREQGAPFESIVLLLWFA